MVGKEDYEYSDTESTGVENNGKITGVRHNNKITGLNSNNESTESVSTWENDEAGEMALIEEAIEVERDIAEGTGLLADTETET